MKLRLVASLIATAMGVAGCSSNSIVASTTTPETSVAPLAEPESLCSLLSVEELNAAFGLEFLDGTPDPEKSVPTCVWTASVPSHDVTGPGDPFQFRLAMTELTSDAELQTQALMADPTNRVVELGGKPTIQECLVEMGATACSNYSSRIDIVLDDSIVIVNMTNFATPDDFTDDEIDTILTAVVGLLASRL